MTSQAGRVFRVTMSERCYRFKPDALPSHAPHRPGVYEFVTFGPDGESIVLYVGLALEKPVYQALADHISGKAEPTAEALFDAAKDVYFDFVAQADIHEIVELQDIAGALITRHKPRFNKGPVPTSGLHAVVSVQETE